MCCKQHAVQVMAHGYLASPASQVRTCIECWGKCWGKVSGQSTLLVKQGMMRSQATALMQRRANSSHTEVSKERNMQNLVAMPAGHQVCLNQVHVCLFESSSFRRGRLDILRSNRL